MPGSGSKKDHPLVVILGIIFIVIFIADYMANK